MTRELIDACLQLAYSLVMAWIIRMLSRDVFQYLNHRLDVLGKDAFLYYPRDRYTMTEDGRMMRTDDETTRPVRE
ncbi:MAG: hypothetical protein ACO32S_05535 [Steroidobacteraceae bacterium]